MKLLKKQPLEQRGGHRKKRIATVGGATHKVIMEPKKEQPMTAKDGFYKGQKVPLLISARTEMGFLADIDATHKGILYKNEVFQPLKIGQTIDGFIKKIREDGKIDLCLQKPGYKSIDVVARKIMDQLEQQGGFIEITDDSSPKRIADIFGVSKKSFKKGVGTLYKKRLVDLEEKGIRLRLKKEKSPDRGVGNESRRDRSKGTPSRRQRRSSRSGGPKSI
jgi:predicted RNA-binding protein (virulence factor B family)